MDSINRNGRFQGTQIMEIILASREFDHSKPMMA
jgi:hypothetical protein